MEDIPNGEDKSNQKVYLSLLVDSVKACRHCWTDTQAWEITLLLLMSSSQTPQWQTYMQAGQWWPNTCYQDPAGSGGWCHHSARHHRLRTSQVCYKRTREYCNLLLQISHKQTRIPVDKCVQQLLFCFHQWKDLVQNLAVSKPMAILQVDVVDKVVQADFFLYLSVVFYSCGQR